eukprot:TRINITY_DN4182_c0_g1_i2.p1 TRINITY_DN4182_c0_g1~~TRINITY_DN4182_c0_g1_i2.p1  ORF type:complete len:439 (+),score=90.94 TRINITY_DN4182_c0_g1_i2:113-1318(+)
MTNSEANVILYDCENEGKALGLAANSPNGVCHLVNLDKIKNGNPPLSITPSPLTPALMVYTSGTTGNPKGVIHTQKSVLAMTEVLINSWKWEETDVAVNCLPLHHLHGLVNVLLCSLGSVATCVFSPPQSEDLYPLLFGEMKVKPTVFMAVPTVYAKLLQHMKKIGVEEVDTSGYRLMVSGSMALPEPLKLAWEGVTGQVLLERYGMTETGMILSQEYDGERPVGTVGGPLKGVEVKLGGEEERTEGFEAVGEILVKSDALFAGYYKNEAATEAAFTADGWFKTGDLAGRTDSDNYTILGRISTDIIKSAGYKLSALEIESALLRHPSLLEVSIIGTPDDVYGEIVTAIAAPSTVDQDELKAHCLKTLAPYKVPRRFVLVDSIPRNTMGKVNKKALQRLFL